MKGQAYSVDGILLGYIVGKDSTFMSYDAKKKLICASPSLDNAKWVLRRERIVIQRKVANESHQRTIE